jgi:hypothetical protein
MMEAISLTIIGVLGILVLAVVGTGVYLIRSIVGILSAIKEADNKTHEQEGKIHKTYLDAIFYMQDQLISMVRTDQLMTRRQQKMIEEQQREYLEAAGEKKLQVTAQEEDFLADPRLSQYIPRIEPQDLNAYDPNAHNTPEHLDVEGDESFERVDAIMKAHAGGDQ